jgi:nitrogen fixation/metabolism regulation signal transduction histidine kinase
MGKIVHSLRFQLPVVVLGVFTGMLFLLMLFFHEMGAILVKTKQLAQSAEINDGVANWISVLSTSARERTKLMSLGKESYLRSFQVTLDEINDLYSSLQTLGPDTLVESVRTLRGLHEKHMEYSSLLDGFAKTQASRRLAKAQEQLAVNAAHAAQARAASPAARGAHRKVQGSKAKAAAKLRKHGRSAAAGKGAPAKGVAGEGAEAKEIELDTASNEVFKNYEQNLREGLYLAQEQMRAERKDKLQSLRNSVGRAKDRLIYSLVLLLVMVAYVAVILKWKILDPMQVLKEGAMEIGNGSLGFQVKVNSRNEIGELSQVFNRMSVQLQQKQHSELRLRRLEAIEQIVRSVNHEINNPLMIISGNAEYLQVILERRNVLQDPDVAAKLDSIVAEVRRIFTVTQRLKEIKEPVTENYIGEESKMIDIMRSSQVRQRDY